MTNRCQGQVYNPQMFQSYRQCKRKGIIERDGKLYCRLHDPVAKQARRKASQEKWEAEYQAKGERRAKLHNEASALAARLGVGRPAVNGMAEATGDVVLTPDEVEELLTRMK